MSPNKPMALEPMYNAPDDVVRISTAAAMEI
jgi:hypothetical protein